MGMFCTDLWETRWLMSSTVGDEGQGGWFGARRLEPADFCFAAVFCFFICIDIFPVFKKYRRNTRNNYAGLGYWIVLLCIVYF